MYGTDQMWFLFLTVAKASMGDLLKVERQKDMDPIAIKVRSRLFGSLESTAID
jgi:hypothetical protein